METSIHLHVLLLNYWKLGSMASVTEYSVMEYSFKCFIKDFKWIYVLYKFNNVLTSPIVQKIKHCTDWSAVLKTFISLFVHAAIIIWLICNVTFNNLCFRRELKLLDALKNLYIQSMDTQISPESKAPSVVIECIEFPSASQFNYLAWPTGRDHTIEQHGHAVCRQNYYADQVLKVHFSAEMGLKKQWPSWQDS